MEVVVGSEGMFDVSKSGGVLSASGVDVEG